jgi:hypothetical protein
MVNTGIAVPRGIEFRQRTPLLTKEPQNLLAPARPSRAPARLVVAISSGTPAMDMAALPVFLVVKKVLRAANVGKGRRCRSLPCLLPSFELICGCLYAAE